MCLTCSYGPSGFSLNLKNINDVLNYVTSVYNWKKLAKLNDDGRKKTRYMEITLATWNVQTMLKPGRMKETMEEIGKARVNIVKWIKGQRISWLGHLERMEEDRLPQKIFTQELEGTRRRGRPRKGCKEEVERDLQVVGERRWRELVADRKKWKDIA